MTSLDPFTEMTEGHLTGYEPAPRWAHVAAAVDDKLYVWGGLRRYLSFVHDGPAKTDITSVVDVLDPQVNLITVLPKL